MGCDTKPSVTQLKKLLWDLGERTSLWNFPHLGASVHGAGRGVHVVGQGVEGDLQTCMCTDLRAHTRPTRVVKKEFVYVQLTSLELNLPKTKSETSKMNQGSLNRR